ncbi:MAG: thiamine diphosphokinase [Treponema sp.]|jgi:thiamine pyrophosphokinase|nr:thiamine diphosphokinase [Treponema sp.]
MEKQQGIVFTGGEGPQLRMLRRLLDGFADKALLAAADSGLLLAEAAGFRPDWIIGDMDSLGSEDRLASYPAERVIRHAADKDYTDTELALALLWEQGCDETWIVGGGGGRLDHLLGIRDLFERERFPRRWLTAAEDIYCINDCGSLTLALEPGALVSVFPLGGKLGMFDIPWKAESMGLKWPLDNVRWERGFFGLSNVVAAPEITINVKQGRFLIITEGLWRRK